MNNETDKLVAELIADNNPLTLTAAKVIEQLERDKIKLKYAAADDRELFADRLDRLIKKFMFELRNIPVDKLRD